MAKRGRADEAESASRGLVVNRQHIADIYGVAPVTVSSWVKRGCPYVQAGRKGLEWLFNTAEVADWREQKAVSEHVGESNEWGIDEARRRREAAQAAMAEIELAKARGTVVDVEAVSDIVGDDYSRVRARLLTLAPKLAPHCHRAESVQEIRQLLDDGVREALDELSGSIDGSFGTEDPGDEAAEAEAAAEADGQRVGRSRSKAKP